MTTYPNPYSGGACPTKDQRKRFYAGQIDEDEKAPLSDHYAECPKCMGAAQTMLVLKSQNMEKAVQVNPVEPQGLRFPAMAEQTADPVEIPFPLTAQTAGGNTRSLFWYVSRMAAAALIFVIPLGAYLYQKNADKNEAQAFFANEMADADFALAQTTEPYMGGEGANATGSGDLITAGGSGEVSPRAPKMAEARAAKCIADLGFADTKITADVLAAKNMTAADKYWLLIALFGLQRYEEGKTVADDLEKDGKAYPHHIKKIALYREKLKQMGL